MNYYFIILIMVLAIGLLASLWLDYRKYQRMVDLLNKIEGTNEKLTALLEKK